MAILGLIGLAILLILIVNTSSLANPTLPIQGAAPSNNPGPTGILLVQLYSNQNQSSNLPDPLNVTLPLQNQALEVYPATNSSGQESNQVQFMQTQPSGRANMQLSPGAYVVNMKDETLNLNIPVEIYAGNVTRLMINVTGAAFPLIYSEESGVTPTANGALSNMYVELGASSPALNVSEPVILQVDGTSFSGSVNATVLARQAPIHGAQWLELGAIGAVDPVNATSLSLTTWSYSSSIIVVPIKLYAFTRT